ncbi:hypothetical protein [Pseudonocardia hydrocarbonoxydans]|uniref:hypothetical protein n=1 Tax=Pseudonocardia hydrocarbonoxydans TaxID=76726 RepID=UPI001477091D|nr:hypothetical protein [Pseudonocardia hydrocarbonoxydans]
MLVLIAPDAAVGSIATAGLVLVTLGALAGAVGRRVRGTAADAGGLEPEYEAAGRTA